MRPRIAQAETHAEPQAQHGSTAPGRPILAWKDRWSGTALGKKVVGRWDRIGEIFDI